jgi:hypothetical protein
MTIFYLPVVSARRINSCVLERLEDRLTGHQEVSLLLRIQLKRGQFNRIGFAASLVEPSRGERAGIGCDQRRRVAPGLWQEYLVPCKINRGPNYGQRLVWILLAT